MVGKSMSIDDIIEKEFNYISEDESLSKALGRFREENLKALVIMRGDNYRGVITERRILKSYFDPAKTKVKALMINAPKVERGERIEKVAQKMVNSDSFVLPVFEGEKVGGIISSKKLIHYYFSRNKEAGRRRVEEVMSKDIVTLSPNDWISRALSIFREYGFTRAPVVSESNKLLGLVTLHDVLTILFKPKHAPEGAVDKRGEFVGEKVKTARYPVKEIMNKSVITITKDESLEDAANLMINNNISSLVVVDKEERVEGIITEKDLLEEVAKEYVEEKDIYINFSFAGDVKEVDEGEIERAREDMINVLERFQSFLGSANVYVYVKQHEERFRGIPLYHVRVRCSTQKGVFIVKAETWGLGNTLGEAIYKLKQQIKYKREMEKDHYNALRQLAKEVADKTILPSIRERE